ncbi:unnamed protein product [Ceutorhynchus assimilis]|uniref:Anaphase-promoting complex subunit 5 n=1 Tax=Ceutorhynchus assimilis TaxID=467358 RepID=A0A9N9MYK9_9CUCU|nr:unnamed protein product [Ceutorhynchus assimilis]
MAQIINPKENLAAALGPTKKADQEMVTPYKLTVALFIKVYCQFRECEQIENASEKVKVTRAFCLLSLKMLQGSDVRLYELKSIMHPSAEVLKVAFEKFDENLENLYTKGIEFLLGLVDELKLVLIKDEFNRTVPSDTTGSAAKGIVTKNSVIGHFLRRFIVYFETLNFSEVSGLYQAFIRFYEEWKKESQNSLSTVVSSQEEWRLDEKQWSRRQAELFLATQAALLQNDEEKALPPHELQNKISSILKSNPDLAESHFMAFLNYLRVEEFCGAIQSLFHCFDRRTNTDVKCYNDEKSKEQRYAALNLAILHHHFGYTKEALASLREAIKIAHEANDNLCLQHALSWLYRLSNVNKDNLIVQCIIKTFELNISYTTSLALQNFAHYGSAKTSVKPSVIFETLTKSDMLNCQHNFKDLIFNNNMMKSSLWRLYGKTEMNTLWAQLLLYLNIDTTTHTAAHYGEGYLQAVCNTALNMLSQGEYDLVNLLLQYAKKKYPNEPLAHNWMLVENFASFTRALYHEKWKEAESAAQKILVLDKWEGYLKLAELLYHQQEYDEATKCDNVVLHNYNHDEHLNDGKFCLLRAKILATEIQYSSSFPDVSGSMYGLNNCLIEAEKSELAYLISMVHLHMANVLLAFGVNTQAIKVLNNPRCMVEILANGSIYDRARANLLYIKCMIADSSRLDTESRAAVICRGAKSLDKVKNDFLKVEAFSRAKDALYFQAQLYNSINLCEERNNSSLEYRLLNEQYPTKNTQTLIKYL